MSFLTSAKRNVLARIHRKPRPGLLIFLKSPKIVPSFTTSTERIAISWLFLNKNQLEREKKKLSAFRNNQKWVKHSLLGNGARIRCSPTSGCPLHYLLMLLQSLKAGCKEQGLALWATPTTVCHWTQGGLVRTGPESSAPAVLLFVTPHPTLEGQE